jgi:hypothetical protein
MSINALPLITSIEAGLADKINAFLIAIAYDKGERVHEMDVEHPAYDALSEALTERIAKRIRRFSPHIGSVVDEYLRSITEGRVDELPSISDVAQWIDSTVRDIRSKRIIV